MATLLTNYGPSVLALLSAVAVSFAPQEQAFVTAHPAVSTVIAALYAILTHALPGSPLGGGTIGIVPPKP